METVKVNVLSHDQLLKMIESDILHYEKVMQEHNHSLPYHRDSSMSVAKHDEKMNKMCELLGVKKI